MHHHFNRINRFVLLGVILVVSLGLVGAALAAASQAGKSIAPAQVNPSQPTAANIPLDTGPHTTIQNPFAPPVIPSQPDPLLEQMRLQAMSTSRKQESPVNATINLSTPEGVAGSTQSSQAPRGAGITYLPAGIVVDTFVHYFYGTAAPYDLVTITRVADGAYGSAETDDSGMFWTPLFNGSGTGEPMKIMPGDQLEFNGTPLTVVEPPSGILDVLNDSLEGNLPGDTGGTILTATLGLYGQPSTAYGLFTAVTDANGDFSVPFGLDLGPENFASLDYQLATGFTQRTYIFPENAFLIQQHGKISGYAPLDSNVHITVYEGEGPTIRWEGDGKAEFPYGWFTIYDVLLDIGDRVVVDFPGGSTEMHYVYSSHFSFSSDDTVSGNVSLPGSEVRISFLAYDGSSAYNYYESHATADDFGDFTVTFPGGGIRSDMRVDVAVMDPSGAGSYMSTGQPYVETIKDFTKGLNCVWGRVDKPNADVILELERDGVIYPRDPSLPIISDPGNMAAGFGMCFNVWYDFGKGMEPMQFQPGDILRLHTDTWSGEVPFYEIHVSPDATINQIDGEIIDGPMDGYVAIQVYQEENAFFDQLTSAIAGSPVVNNSYATTFEDYDIRGSIGMNTFFYDPVTGFANQLQDENHYFLTIDNLAVTGHTYIPDEPLTLRLIDPGTLEPVYTSTNDIDSDPHSFYFDFSDCNPVCAPNPPLQPGIIVEMDYGFSGDGDRWLIYEDIQVDGDPEQDLINGYGKDGLLIFTAGFDGENFHNWAPTIGSQAVINTTAFGYDLGWGESATMIYWDPLGNYQWTSKLLGEIRRVEFWMNPNGQTWVWGTAQPSSEVVVQTSRGDTLHGYTEALNGNFGTDHSTLLLPGDTILVTAGEGLYPVTIEIPDIHANSDSADETVSGNIGLGRELDVEIYPWWKEEMKTTRSDAEGNFSQSFGDIPHQGRGYIRIVSEQADAPYVDAIFHKPFYDLQPAITANYAHDWVESQYDPGYSVVITVTDAVGELKATAHGETAEIPWWGGDTGFATGYNVFWDDMTPDLQSLDHVYLDIAGHSAEFQLGEISGELDVAADTLMGTVIASWLTFPVNGDCGVWIENGQGVGFTTDEQGNFTCDFTGIWDLQPGMDIGVGYYDDAHKVYNVFSEPAPHLYVNLEQQGEPAEGNNYAFRVHYNNDGMVMAEDVVITQTFTGMTYLSDTSGFPHQDSSAMDGTVVWEVGDVPVNRMTDSTFFVFVRVDDPANVSTVVDINTALPYYYQDYGSRHFEWGREVALNDSDLNLGKWVWTGDPVPGYEYVYVLNVCNNGSTSSSEVWITDTLSISTTLLNWWGQQPGWEQVSASDHELVVKRPTVSGYTCSEVYLNVSLTDQAQSGDLIANQAITWAESDLNPEDNSAYQEVKAGTPSYNLHMNRNWSYGQFTPGGEIGFEFGFQNWGNMVMPGTQVYVTLPQGTEFMYAYSWDWSGWYLITPTVVGDGYLLWDIGDFPNGYNREIGLRLKIHEDAEVGMPLILEARVSGDLTEWRYDDNLLVYTEEVHDYGPNLRVDKHTNWRWNWEGTLYYELRILNVGSAYLDNPVVTDTYPISTTFAKCWFNHGPGDLQPCSWDDNNHQAVFNLDYLNPGDTASANLVVDLKEDIGMQGLEYVNQAEISDFGDIAPEDNFDEVISYTGPDVFVSKTLKEGEIRAGELVTYTVVFGNQNRWPWNGDPGYGSHITDTLPNGMSFVRAIGYWSPTEDWNPVSNIGQQVVWEWGPMWAEQTWTFDLVAQIDEGIPGGSELLNSIEAWGDSPTDIEVNPDNNYSEFLLTTILYKFQLPITLRAP